jgi:FkbM family methyltransferase
MDTTGSMRTSVVLVYQKVAATPPGGWKNVENDLLAALARTTPERDPLAVAQAFAPAEPPLRRVPNARFGAGYDDDRPDVTMRCSIWNSLTKNFGADGPPVIVPFYGGVRLAAQIGNDVSLCTYAANEFEPNEFFMLSTVLRPKMVALDIGANEGLYTCFIASRVGRQGRVIAVEPSSRERRRLERNIALNLLENVTVYDCAIGDTPGTAALHLAEGRYSGQNTLGEFVHAGIKECGVEEIRVRTIDEIVVELGLERLDLIKIDVEGLEASAIRGAAETLRRFRPIVQIEITPETMAHRGESAAALLQSFTALGYELLRIDRASGATVPCTSLDGDSENIFAMPGKRAPQVAAPAPASGFYDAVTASLTGATP